MLCHLSLLTKKQVAKEENGLRRTLTVVRGSPLRYFATCSMGEKMFTCDDGRAPTGVPYVPAALKDWRAINKSRPEDGKKVDQKRQ